ncbi:MULTISPECIES: sugar ABC transporter substrate-binding protein [Streptomyces]|uniref:sugar ABC transporter substrate-binding protein n=2 Tax=Streptomyces TaxID=1883 RepID=UPI00017E986C|nr:MULTISPECIES: substrate-binding domain-containing protein [Streptomyces]MBP0936855.1 substrate-binding domain-containing protein [Streptomyces sp. KCTC 0041BP]EDX25889.1 ABC transporter solute-binding protein [Streptomyces sp. Mg1]RPK36466.1 D-xylose-binding periplasmic protein precursor [Streptomyces sp. ADI91-18]WBY22604.1 substrate-binding domain-containing protein [Streptomyces goshikiensis]WSX97529.1 substrate-binding domain-containing protein [Streptomyces goshikiensis]
MNTRMRRAAVAVAAGAMAVSLAACGSAKESGSGSKESGAAKGDAIKVGLLLPENQTARYEKFDKPLIEKKVADLTGGKGEVIYANAKQDATTQNSQVDTMITNKVNVLIVDAVDSKAIAGAVKRAKDAGIPVVAYDRLAEGPIDAYTSFDNEEVGKVQGKALVEALGEKAKDGQIVMMNGSVTDPNAKLFKSGAHSVLDGKVNVGKEYDTVEWKPENANTNMAGALSALGKDKVIGVYSANDGMAGGIITALKAAGVNPLPPVTGQDAELAGVQRIVAGEQFMSVYKPYAPEATAAAEMAVALAKGEKIDDIINQKVDSPTAKGVPSVLIPVVSLTKANIKDTVVKDGVYKVEEICTDKYAAACATLGLK